MATSPCQHIAVIMDGNGRWAKARSLPRIAGHRAGVKAVETAIDACRELGVKILTLYTFSTENWKRPKEEVDALFRLLEDYLDKELPKLMQNRIRFSVIGRINELPKSLQSKIAHTIEATKANDSLILNLALNYGSRSEITDAVKSIASEVRSGNISPESIDEKCIGDHLYTKALPDPDLLIRTSGEMRLSNFLLWQLSYSEICILKKFWPDFTREDLKAAIDDFSNRQRRYGG